MLTPESLDALDTISLEGSAPPRRLKTAGAALRIYERLKEEDKESSHNRAIIQGMMDGEAPYSQAKLVAAGQGFRTNLNFGEAEAALDDAQSAYIDLLNSPEWLVTVGTTFGEDPQERIRWNQTLGTGLTKMLREWTGFVPTELTLVNYFLTHGVGLAYFADEKDWRWKVGRFGEFLIPRRTEANVDAIEIAFCRREMAAHELYGFIENEELAKKVGWNVEAVKKAIRGSVDNNRLGSARTDEWETWQEMAKDCDLAMTAVTNNVLVLHCWVKEFNGKVSHYILLENSVGKSLGAGLAGVGGDGKEAEFLFAKPERFESMARVFVVFTFGVGNTGNFHGIRGLGHRIHPYIQVSNRLHCQMTDSAAMSGSVMLKSTSQNYKDALGIAPMGPYTVIPEGVEVQPMNWPNLGQTMMPAMQEVDRLKRARTGQYSPANVLPERGEMTRAEVNSRISTASQLSAANLSLYYDPRDRLFREVVRRIVAAAKRARKDDAITELLEYLEQENCPVEALLKIDLKTVRAVRAIGGGSQSNRDAVYGSLLALAGGFDPTGRTRLYRDRAASLLGGDYSTVDRYIPAPEDGRVGLDAKLAELENGLMQIGQEQTVRPNDMHLDHLRVHVEAVVKLIASVDEGAALEGVVQPLTRVHSHAVIHMEAVQGDTNSSEDIALFRKALSDAGETIINGTRRLQKLMRDAEAAGGAEGEAAGTSAEGYDRLEREVQEANLRLQMAYEKHQQEMAMRAQRAELDLRILDAKTALEVKNKY